jgi:hypothetical protein
MSNRLRDPASPASGHEAAAAAGREFLIGRRSIATALQVSERTVTRRMAAGTLPAGKIGAAKNNALIMRRDDAKVR